jgi:hypothetical protein
MRWSMPASCALQRRDGDDAPVSRTLALSFVAAAQRRLQLEASTADKVCPKAAPAAAAAR